MLSNPLHRFSPYHSMPASTLMSNTHTAHHLNGLDTLSQGSHYALQQLHQHVDVRSPHLARPSPQQKQRQHPYGPTGRSASASGPIRRRISRACDQCNQLRTKCDGQHPCAHCIGESLWPPSHHSLAAGLERSADCCKEFGLGCEYIRERKKRGKASRKDLAQQAAAQAAATQSGGKSPSQPTDQGETEGRNDSVSTIKSSSNGQASVSDKGLNDMQEDAMQRSVRTGSMESIAEMGGHQPHMDGHPHPASVDRDRLDNPAALDLNGYGNVHAAYDRQGMASHMLNGGPNAPYGPNQGHISSYPDLPYALQTQSPTAYPGNPGNSFRLGASPMGAYPMAGEPTSPGWMNMSSPRAQYASHVPPQNHYSHPSLRYPVLEPLLPHLGSLMPVSLACDLIELYFASSSSAQMHPMSPYVLGFVFRKRSFLHPTKPRQCQPALLASILWVAAQTSDAPFLTSVPSARAKICQKLLELTVSLLKPLIHTPSGEVSPVSSPIADGVALGGLGVALPGTISMDALSGESGAFGAAGSLDDVATYIHLATVVSASEYKGASIRWWNAAWSLARELKLNRELPQNAPSMQPQHSADMNADTEAEEEMGAPGVITEEEREERRRIWWLVYIVDRHLAVCYNRPLFLLDIECEGLLQPMDDTAWQNGEFYPYSTDPSVLAADPTGGQQLRPKGPRFECTGHSIFGYFLPLMTILGEIVDLHHARNHPRFGVAFRSSREWEEQTAEIVRHLEAYECSLKMFEQCHIRTLGGQHGEDKVEDGLQHDLGTPPGHSVHSVHTSSSRMTESDIQTRIVFAYGTHVMHVLHILLTGKWDPINLLDDNDLWISSQGFITATGHAVSAAEAINQILEFDPGLEFMPFFFGIYLLQGSFLLLLIADKLQSEASPSVVKACETIVRAHEACVVTLNTEYQVNIPDLPHPFRCDRPPLTNNLSSATSAG